MGKRRVLMCAESSHIDSGFGNYTRNIMSRLYNTGKYEIAELSAYRNANTPKSESWKIYPNVPTSPEALKLFHGNPSNVFGAWAFETACIDFKPDIVMDIRDYWMMNFVEISPLRPYFHWFIAPTIDSSPQKMEWLQTFSSADTLSAHTQWGIDYLKSTNIPCNIVAPVNDSVDIETFTCQNTPKELIKGNLGINPNDFIIGSVMRNQKRKLIPNLIKIIKRLNNENNNIKLYLHTSYPDLNAWDIPTLLLEHDALDIVYFTYKCQTCKKHFASLYQEPPMGCRFCKNQSALLCSVANGVNSTELAGLYNAFDIYIQYAICEGFGIPPVEAAACGIPVVTVDHGAMREIGDNINADIVPLACLFRELETNADRVSPNDDKCFEILLNKFRVLNNMSLAERIDLKDNLRNKLISSYSWNKTAKQFEDILDNIELTKTQGKWEDGPKLPMPEVKVPPLPSNRHIIYFILDHVIRSPHLKYTSSIQNIIKAVDNQYIINNGKIQKFTLSDGIKSMENLMNGKSFWEQARIGGVTLPQHFMEVLNYGQK